MKSKLLFPKPSKRKKLRKIGSLKKQAWRVFSEWVRRRDEKQGCATCGVKVPWKQAHAGHFYHSHTGMSFMDERNVHLQCVKCNHYLSGNLINYSEFMRKTYGPDIIEVLRELKMQIWKPTRQELEDIIQRYKNNV